MCARVILLASYVLSQLKTKGGITSHDAVDDELIRIIESLSMQETRENAVQKLVKRISATSANYEPILVTSNAIDPLVEAVRDSGVRSMATFILSSIAQTPEGRDRVVAAGALGPIAELARNESNKQGQIIAAQALGRIALDPITHTSIEASGGVDALVQMLRNAESGTAESDDANDGNIEASGQKSRTAMQLQTGSIFVIGLLAVDEGRAVKMQKRGVTAVLASLLKRDDANWDGAREVKGGVTHALRAFAAHQGPRRVLSKKRLMPALVRELRHGSPLSKMYCAYTVGNLLDNDNDRRRLLKAGGLPLLLELLPGGSAAEAGVAPQSYILGAVHALGSAAVSSDCRKELSALGLLSALRQMKEDPLLYAGNEAGGGDEDDDKQRGTDEEQARFWDAVKRVVAFMRQDEAEAADERKREESGERPSVAVPSLTLAPSPAACTQVRAAPPLALSMATATHSLAAW